MFETFLALIFIGDATSYSVQVIRIKIALYVVLKSFKNMFSVYLAIIRHKPRKRFNINLLNMCQKATALIFQSNEGD